MRSLGSVASIVAAIREDAAAEVERIEESAAAEIASICVPDVSIADREERLALARRMNEERLARQEWEGRRAVIEQREEWIQRVVAAAPARWDGDTAPLIRDAMAQLPANAGQARVDGCVVSAGNVSFDNSLEARSKRLESEWRSALSALYSS